MYYVLNSHMFVFIIRSFISFVWCTNSTLNILYILNTYYILIKKWVNKSSCSQGDNNLVSCYTWYSSEILQDYKHCLVSSRQFTYK